jgi:hypothetical protein
MFRLIFRVSRKRRTRGFEPSADPIDAFPLLVLRRYCYEQLEINASFTDAIRVLH